MVHHSLFVYFFILLTMFTLNFQITHAGGTFELNVTPTCRVKPCSMYLRVCLRNYVKVINLDQTLVNQCSYGGSTITPKEYGKVQKIEFNFTWPRDFALVIEGYNSSDLSERNAAKHRIFRHAFQEVLEAEPEWKEHVFNINTTSISTKMRIFCDSKSFGRQCSHECVPTDNVRGHYECTENGDKKCLPGWSGKDCLSPVCSEGCRNGTCSIPGGCDCKDGFEGVHCDKCKVFPGCKHGTCSKPWECNCDEGWAGTSCDKDLNFCTHHNPCVKGICFNEGEDRYTCECILGYTGTNCDIPIVDCTESPCKNGGNCSPSTYKSNYTCDCPPGYTGVNCETPLSSECDIKLCENGGTCSNGPSGYLCICPPGYTGPNCEIRFSSCNQSPCRNDGQCISSSSSLSSYTCNCRAGFNGTHCENNINDCSSDVEMCFNGGICIDGDNSYTCSCLPGFTGSSCQTNIDECSSSPCKNGGQCTDLINGFTCKCPPGFSGIDCSSLNEPTPPPPTCNPSYCFNGGTCKVTTYTAKSSSTTRTTTSFAICLCRPGFHGLRCEYPPEVLPLVRSEKSLPDPLETTTESIKFIESPSKPLVVHFTTPSVPAPVSSFSSFERIISTNDMTLISVVALIVPIAIIIFLVFRFSKQRIQVEERKKYENEEAIRQNEENSSKKCLQNDSCLTYNDLNRDSMRIVNGHPSLSLSHPHLHPSLLSPGALSQTNTLLTTVSPQCTSSLLSSSSSSSSSSCNNKKLSNDDYIVNELTIDPSLTIYGLTSPPTLPPLTLSTDPSGISTTTSHSCHPSPVYSKYATLTSHHHHHPHLHSSGSVVDLHYLHHHIVT